MEQQKRYGHFDDEHREYVITDPKTPWPWINYLGNEDFFSLISNTAGGYSFYKDAKFRRITRYRYNNVPMDNGGRYFYIKDGDTVWNPGWKPCKTPLDFYECRHGMSYTRITGKKNGVEASVLFFVPLKKWAEVQKLTLKNESAETKSLKLFSFEEWCLWNAATDMENFQRNFSTGEVEIETTVPEGSPSGATIYHKTEYRERRNHYAFYHVNVPVQGYDTDRETFVGLYNEFANPDAVMEGKPRNSHAHGWSPIASHYIEVTLAPGESKDFVFLLGYIENEQDKKFEAPQVINKEKAHALISELDTTEKVDKAFAELCEYWDALLNIYKVKTGNDKLDRMVNIWNQYQCMVTFNFSRSASFFESGVGRGMGFRDSNQDLVGFVHQIPPRARQRIIDIASTQFPDGGCYHQYQPLTKRGNNDIWRWLQRRPLLAHLRYRGLHQGDGRLLHTRRNGALRQPAGYRGDALRAPEDIAQPRYQQPRPSHAAAHRTCRLERLPQPELLLMGSQRELPDYRERQRRHESRIAHDCRTLRSYGQGIRNALREDWKAR